MKQVFFLFGVGAFTGLLQALLMWQIGRLGVTGALHIDIAPVLTIAWMYKKVVWGGLWALLFLLPMQESRYIFKGLIISLFPVIAQLFFIYPFLTGYGFAGLKLGLLTPFYILFVFACWGVMTSLTIRLAK